MAIALTFFLIALSLIVALFFLKRAEERREIVYAPRFRATLDRLAEKGGELLSALKADLEKLPPEMLHIMRVILHETALMLARLLRFLSLQSHRLADLVSQKRSFQRRAPRSEFLQKVIEHKIGNGGEVEQHK